MTGSLGLITSNRLEVLCDEMARRMRDEPLEPMTPEVVVVQSPGMEKWLRLELSRRLGVSANLQFPFPNAFLARTLRSVLPAASEAEAYGREALTWRLVRILSTPGETPGFPEIAEYLAAGDADDDGRVYQLARLLSDTFDQYLTYRPDMIRRWEAGEDADWQANLWRRVVADLEESGVSRRSHIAASEAAILARLRDPVAGPELDFRRVSVFGIPALPPLHLRLLAALSGHLPVDVYFLCPSREYWALDLSERGRARIARRKPQTPPEGLALGGGNALLSSLGKLGADFLDLMMEHDPQERELYQEPGEDTLLRVIQTDILRAAERAEPYTPRSDDQSIRIQSCHSATREAEVLRDFLLDLFDRNPRLTPSDVLVMTPSISRYGPALEAVFQGAEDGGVRLPVAVSDRPLLEQTGLARTVFRILDLPESRCAATEILALAADGAVQARFGLDTVDLETLAAWIDDAGIRWGLDAEHRAELDLPAVSENTWLAGLDRLLLGYAVSPEPDRLEEALYAGVAPAAMHGARSDLLGALVDLLEAVREARRELRRTHPAGAWPGVIREVLGTLLGTALEGEGDGEAISASIRALEHSVRSAGAASGVLGVRAVRAAFRQGLREERSTGRFLSGRLMVCEMLPMRSIPAEVICLVGMNDDAFPGRDRGPGFDRMRREPRKGDRSKAQSDRYLFLETILSARSVLYVSYVGQSIRDNATLPPAVPVSLLLDYVRKIAGTPGSVWDDPVVRHPLQPFSPVYLSNLPRLYTYSRHNALAARALATSPKAPRRFCPSPLPEEDPGVIELAEVNRFYRNPARYFVRRRLGFRVDPWENEPEDREPFVLRELERYRIGEELTRLALGGVGGSPSPAAVLRAYRAQGRLPHGEVGDLQLGDLVREVEELRDRVLSFGQVPSGRTQACTVVVDGRRVQAALPEPSGERRVAWRWGRLRATDMIDAWLTHLVSLAASPDAAPGGTVFVATDRTLVLGSVPDALERLRELVGQYRWGLREPLEFFSEASLAYAQAVGSTDHESALRKARGKYDPPWGGERGESTDPYVRLCFDGAEPLEAERFAGLATLVYGPLLEAVRTEGGP